MTIYNPENNIAGKPDYWQTIRYVFQHINFPISEDEAYVITNLFIEKWDTAQGQLIYENDLKKYVLENCRSRVMLMLSEEKIFTTVDLIISYLKSINQFYHE